MHRTFNRRTALSLGASMAALTLWRPAGAQTPAQTLVMGSTVTTGPFVEVETVNGRVRGGHSRGALAFKGIPYAGSVSGAARFLAPPPAPSWSGVRDALQLGPPSLQKPHSTYGENEPPYEEDCLVLNVWTPAVNDGKKRPVMVYNHGGGYATGSAGSSGQDGAHMAAAYDVVVVASNHRLGLLGYLYLGEIGGEAYATSGNQGMLDIVAALQWVKANITAFGGDPDNVMISGESGGGFKTGTLLAMPAAHGLFHKASIESGATLRRMSKSAATETAHRVLRGLGIAPAELHKLADVPGQAFIDMQLAIEQGHGPLTVPFDLTLPMWTPGLLHGAGYSSEMPGGYGPVVDGAVLPSHPFDPVASPLSANIPLMVGNNRDEATFFNMGRPDTFSMDEAAFKARMVTEFQGDAERIIAAYRQIHPTATPSQLYIAIATARWFGSDTITAADRKSAQPAPVYRYRYDHPSNLKIAGTNATLDAGHATDITAKFLNYDVPGLEGDDPGLAAASRTMSALWASFAHTSVPSAPGQPAWPRYDTRTRATMLIDGQCHVVNDPDMAARQMWETVTTV